MNEYISREAVLKAFKLKVKNPKKDYQRGMQDAIDCLIPEVIADIPSADVKPVKHGRWITWDDSGFTKCSCCNSEYYIADLQEVGDSEGFVEFCPNCGAKMDGGDK